MFGENNGILWILGFGYVLALAPYQIFNLIRVTGKKTPKASGSDIKIVAEAESAYISSKIKLNNFHLHGLVVTMTMFGLTFLTAAIAHDYNYTIITITSELLLIITFLSSCTALVMGSVKTKKTNRLEKSYIGYKEKVEITAHEINVKDAESKAGNISQCVGGYLINGTQRSNNNPDPQEPMNVKVPCPKCIRGKVECSDCNGSGRQKCPTCHGRGKVTHIDAGLGLYNKQNAAGLKTTTEQCITCSATGYVGICRYCNGHREVVCPLCIGTRKVSKETADNFEKEELLIKHLFIGSIVVIIVVIILFFIWVL